MLPQPMILESQNAMSAADGATTEPRIRINRPDEGRRRCKGSRAPGQRKDFSQPTQPLTTLSTFNAISPQQKRTEPSGPRRCRRGAKSSLQREPDMPAELLRALFGNVTKPSKRMPSASTSTSLPTSPSRKPAISRITSSARSPGTPRAPHPRRGASNRTQPVCLKYQCPTAPIAKPNWLENRLLLVNVTTSLTAD